MAISADVTAGVGDIIDATFNVTKGTVVPKTEDVVMKDGAKEVDATYVYADLADSSNLARVLIKEATAKVIRSYINASARILRHYGGEIRSFDGDRVMAIFMGPRKNNDAVRAALAINWAVRDVIKPKLVAKWSTIETHWTIGHGVGIDTGQGWIVRGGVRNHNDLISVGRAPNIAAKLSDLRGEGARLFITAEVFNALDDAQKTSAGRPMWTSFGTMTLGGAGVHVYGSNYQWQP